jgi:mannan endo-1,4-beta-mannosidase
MNKIFTLIFLAFSLNLFSQTEVLKSISNTTETYMLLSYLHTLSNSNDMLLGHHLSNVERQAGKDWNKAWDPTYSDVYEATGSMPAVFSFDFGRGISKATEHCKAVFSWGGIVTISWHADNPATGGNNKDVTGNPMGNLAIEGTTANVNWKAQLDLVADELNGLTLDSKKVPVIFRPFHEHTGSWFWWGKGNCTTEQFVTGWQYTVDYLRAKGVNNILMAYSPSKPAIDDDHKNYTQATYPGDDYVDILGFDQYDENYVDLVRDARYMVEMAESHGKVAAITEFGNRNGLNNDAGTIANWFSENLEPVHADPIASKVAYALTWMNTGEDKYWTPLENDKQYDDFVTYVNRDYSLLLNDLPDIYGREINGDLCGIKYEAEDAEVITPAFVENSSIGYSGSGYVSFNYSEPGIGKVNFSVTVDDAGEYQLDLGYLNSNTNGKKTTVLVNGVTWLTNVELSPNLGFSTINLGKVSLESGENTITIERGWGYWQLDFVEIKSIAT